MYELLIVDDETLAQIGIKSILDYEKLGVKVVGSASNGLQALDFIRKYKPQIVITDIKMPVMDGLELVEHCNSEFDNPPKFIILTGFEEFAYVRRAMRSNVVDYIIKVELDEFVLQEILKKTISMLQQSESGKVTDRYAYDMLLNRTLTKLLSHAFTSEPEMADNLKAFRLDMDGHMFVAVAAEVNSNALNLHEYRDFHNLFLAIMNTIQTIVPKYAKGRVVAYSSDLIGIILSFAENENWEEICRKMLVHAGGLSAKYFNVALRFGVGTPEPSLYNLTASFGCARRVLHDAQNSEPIMFYREMHQECVPFALNQVEILQDLASAFENFDAALFSSTINRVAAGILDPSTEIETAIDNVSSIIHTIIISLDSGKKLLEETFAHTEKSYHIIYSCSQRQELEEYLRRIQKNVVKKLEEYLRRPRNWHVAAARRYIQDHVSEKLTLGVVAEAIGVTPNYLSSIFKKNCHYGFIDYIIFVKIRRAQQLLLAGNLKVYQIAEMLGFDNPYYFSTVYKKFTGFSPKETVTIHSISREEADFRF